MILPFIGIPYGTATALGACERLMSLYREIKTTDETALALRRVPFFDTALEMAAEAFAQLDESKRAAAWFAQYRGAFDDVGNEMLANAIAGDRTFKRRS